MFPYGAGEYEAGVDPVFYGLCGYRPRGRAPTGDKYYP